MAEEGRWIGSGGFKIDREAALKKLARYQLREPETFALALIRAGVARGAKKISVELDGLELGVGLDGAVFTRSELAGVLDALLDGDADPARRHLATGLLAAAKIAAKPVRVVSGGPGEALQVDIDAGGRTDPVASKLKKAGTAVAFAAAPAASLERLRDVLQSLESECAASPAPIEVAGVEVPCNPLPRLGEEAEDGWLAFGKGRLRAWVRPSFDRLEGHHAAFSCQGVRAATMELPSDLCGVDAMIRHDGLALDLSQGGVVKDARFEEAGELLRRAAGGAVEKIAAEASARLSKRWKAMTSGKNSFAYWREALRTPYTPYWRPGWLGGEGLVRFLTQTVKPVRQGQAYTAGEELLARQVAWLRAGCLKLEGPEADAARPGAAALWNTPLFFTHSGKRVTLARVEAVRAKTGQVHVEPRFLEGDILTLLGGHKRECASVYAMTELLQGEEGDTLRDETYT